MNGLFPSRAHFSGRSGLGVALRSLLLLSLAFLMLSVVGCQKKTSDVLLQGAWILDTDASLEQLKAGEERMSDERMATFDVGMTFSKDGKAEMLLVMGERRETHSGMYEITNVGDDSVTANITFGRSEDSEITQGAIITFLTDNQMLFVPADRQQDSLIFARSTEAKLKDKLSAVAE